MTVDFFQNGLCLHCNSEKNELVEFSVFHKLTEENWEQKDEILQSELSDKLKEYDEKYHDDIIENYAWDLGQNQSTYPNIHRESLLITLYSFLENSLNSLCTIIDNSLSSKVTIKDLRGNGIERSKLYLKKVAEFNFESFGNELSFISKFNRLRNALVHNGGLLPLDENDQLNNFVNESDFLTGEPGRYIRINSDFITHLIKVLMEFFDKLGEQVEIFIRKFNTGNIS